jgi:hypothetical protein
MIKITFYLIKILLRNNRRFLRIAAYFNTAICRVEVILKSEINFFKISIMRIKGNISIIQFHRRRCIHQIFKKYKKNTIRVKY